MTRQYLNLLRQSCNRRLGWAQHHIVLTIPDNRLEMHQHRSPNSGGRHNMKNLTRTGPFCSFCREPLAPRPCPASMMRSAGYASGHGHVTDGHGWLCPVCWRHLDFVRCSNPQSLTLAGQYPGYGTAYGYSDPYGRWGGVRSIVSVYMINYIDFGVARMLSLH